MTPRDGCRAGFFGVWALVLAACASAPDTASRDGDAFAGVRAVEVFHAGFIGITEKYIDTVATGDIAFEGLRGLGALDPGLSVTRDGGRIILSFSGQEVTRLAEPAPDDGDGWARLAVDVTAAARTASAEMRVTDAEAVYEAVFDGALSNLDIFSRYAGAEEAEQNRSKRDGFGGIGIRYRIMGGVPVIRAVMERTPADVAGLKSGDRITHVDGKALMGLDRRAIAKLMRGPTHTDVALTLERPGAAPRVVVLARAHIYPTTVFETRKNGLVFLRINSFNQDTARALAEVLERARATMGDAMRGVVLDLRGNPGGLLKQSVKVADLLLTQGHIVATRGRHADSIHHYEAGGRDLAFGLPVVVLIDGKSASAAEIVAAALQDRERAVVIGTASFGKGSVQTVIRLPNDGEITLTWSRLVAPSGYYLHGLGVLPSICTSGVPGGAAGVITRVMNERAKTEDAFNAWRKPGLRNDAERRQLRESCPSQRRPGDVEVEAARLLLGDRTLYTRALAITSGTHEARY